MAFTSAELDVVNMALGRIGSTRLANVGDTTSNIALHCLLQYPQVRKALLRSHDWNFAIAHLPLVSAWETATGYTTDQYVWTNSLLYKCAIALTAVKWVLVTDRPLFGCWQYRYLLPANYLRFVEAEHHHIQHMHYIIEDGYIWTHRQALNIKYVWDVTDPTLFDSLFTDLLILKLALRLIPPLAGTMSQKDRSQLGEELRVAESQARLVDQQEDNTSGKSSWNMARFGHRHSGV